MNRPDPPSFSPRHSLKVTLLLPLMIFSGLAGIGGGWLVHGTVSDELRTQILARAEILANAINYAAETAFESTQLQRQVAAIGGERDVNLILVAAGQPARIVASTRRPWLGLTLDALPNRHLAAELEGVIGKRRGFTEFHGDTHELNVARALELNDPGITDGRLDQGAVLVYLNARPMQRALNLADALLSVWLTTVLATVGGLAYWLVTRRILLPAQAIATTIQRRASGDSGARTNVTDDDEIGTLARTLDNLLDTQDAAEYKLATSYAALRDSEEQFRALFRNAGIGIALVDMKGHPIHSNPALQGMLGYSGDELRGMPFTKFTHPEDADKDMNLYRELMAGTRDTYRMEKRYYRKDGQLIHADLTVTLIHDAEGQPQFGIGMVEDITERKQAEYELQQEREFLKAVLNNIQDGVVACDAKGTLSLFNRATEEFHGLPQEPMPPEKWAEHYDLYLPDGETPMCREDIPLFRALNGETVRHVEMVIAPKQGKTRSLIASGQAFHDQGGTTLGAVVSMHDITEQKRAESALRESEERYRRIVETAEEGIWVIDAESNTSFVNRKMADMLGYTEEEMLGQSLDMFMDIEGQAIAAENVERRRAGISEQHDFKFRRKDGTQFWALIGTNPILDDHGQYMGALAMVTDITTRRQAEAEIRKLNEELEERVRRRTAELEAINRELESFSYSVSHDLRAPLRGIDGWSLALLEDYGETLKPTAREYLERVRAEAQRMGELIDDLLTLARVMRGEMLWQEVDLSAIAEKQAEALQNIEPNRKVEWYIQPGLATHGDPRLLNLVLQNLIGNAWKFTSRHDMARIEFGITEEEGNRTFFVRDDGAGFDMAYAEKLFAPFQRLHRPTDFPGTGVGLAITQRIVQRHGGRIWPDAAVEKGATFYFTLGES